MPALVNRSQSQQAESVWFKEAWRSPGVDPGLLCACWVHIRRCYRWLLGGGGRGAGQGTERGKERGRR